MIVSFKDGDTEKLAGGRRVKRFVSIETVARRKLRQLEIAGRLDDLRVPPGNRLEAAQGRPRRSAQHPRQRPVPRLLPLDSRRRRGVEIVDYH